MKRKINKTLLLAACAILLCSVFASCGKAELSVNEEMQSELDVRRGLGPPTVTFADDPDCSAGHTRRWEITESTHRQYCSVCGESLNEEKSHEPLEIIYMRGYLVIEDRTYIFRSFECSECGARLRKTYTPLDVEKSEVGK